MVRILIPLVLILIACSDPAGPQGVMQGSSQQQLSFQRLGLGDTLIVDQHSTGCFMVSDAHLVFLGTAEGAVVSGEVRLSGRRGALVPRRELTRAELGRLDNLLTLYRREQHQTRCLSTGARSTMFATGAVLAERYDTDVCIEVEYVGEGQSFSIRPRGDIITLYEFTEPAFDKLFKAP